MRKGMGKNKGMGYKNITGKDPKVHSDSARGIKTAQNISPSLKFQQKRMEKEDLFSAITREGNLLVSGLDKNFNPYRIIEFRGKKFRMTIEEEK